MTDRKEVQYFLLIALLVFLFQPIKLGFDMGGHLGWVPSHVAGILIKATPENGFVGYSLQTFDTQTLESSYEYFDRYPVVFSALFRLLTLPFEDNLGLWIFTGRQIMNLIYLLTLFYSYRVLCHFSLFSKGQRLAIVLLTFSGHYYVQYKSMIHFDQPALLGMVALFYSILNYRKTGKKRSLLFWIFFAPLLGRGYASFFLLAAWLIVESYLAVRKKNIRKFIISAPVWLSIASGGVCTSFLIYNVYQEAQLKDIPMNQVGIVNSAQRRLGLAFQSQKEKEVLSVGWPKFVYAQIARSVRHVTPYSLNYLFPTRAIFSVSLIIFFFISLKRFWLASEYHERADWFILVLSGFLWVFTMKSLTHFHDYTMMYYFGITLFIYSSSVYFLKRFKYILPISFIIFVSSLSVRFYTDTINLQKSNQITAEFSKIRDHLETGDLVWIPEGRREILEGRPYSMGFYLFDQVLAKHKKGADFILSKNEQESAQALYEGKYVNLYRQRLTTSP